MGGYDSTHGVTHHPAESITDSCGSKQNPESMLRNVVEINEQCFRPAGQECSRQESAEEQSRQVHLGTILCGLNKERCVFVNGGEGGIRTLGTLFTYTRFPGVHLRPLGHLSQIILTGSEKFSSASKPRTLECLVSGADYSDFVHYRVEQLPQQSAQALYY